MIFYHGSYSELPIKTLLQINPDSYSNKNNLIEDIFEVNRPDYLISRKKSIYLSDNIEDIDNLGGYNDFIYEVELVDSNIEKSDLNWYTMAFQELEESNGVINSKIEKYIKNYWNGVSSDSPCWEYRVEKASIKREIKNDSLEFLKIKKINKSFEHSTRDEIYSHLEQNFDWLKISKDDISFSEGYLNKNNEILPKIGANMVDKSYLYSIYHEVAHMIEMLDSEPERILLPTFGMQYTTKTEYQGIEYNQPVTTSAIERECRVFAIQSKLMAKGFNLDEEHILHKIINENQGLDLMDDFLNIQINKKDNHNIDDDNKMRMKVVNSYIFEHFKNIDIEKLTAKLNTVAHYRNFQNWSLRELDKHSYHDICVESMSEKIDLFQFYDVTIDKKIFSNVDIKNLDSIDTSCASKKELKLIDNVLSHIKNKQHKQEVITIKREGDQFKISEKDQCKLLANFLTFQINPYQKRRFIRSKIEGDIDYFKKEYLFNPNVFSIAYSQKKKKKDHHPSKLSR